MRTHELRTVAHTDELEVPTPTGWVYYFVATGTEGFQVGDGIVLTSADGDVFIGEVADKDDATQVLWLSLF